MIYTIYIYIYIYIYINNPEPFTEVIKNLELKNNGKIKEILDTKVIKSQKPPKNRKEYSPLLHSQKTWHKGLPNAIRNDEKYVI